MDNLVLIRVAAALHASIGGAVLRDLREEASARFRLIFDGADGPRSVLVSLRPELPWIGRPFFGARARVAGVGSPFAAQARRALLGALVGSVTKLGVDRALRISFADGHALVAELATHGANLLLLDERDRILGWARRPKSAGDRIAPESRYHPRDLPPRSFMPQGQDASAIDHYLREREREGERPFETLRRHVFGVGTEAARLIVAEAAASGMRAGQVLVARLSALERGELDPVIAAPRDPFVALRGGQFDAMEIRLLPWDPGQDGAAPRFRGADAAETAGLFHETLEASALLAGRRDGLCAVLARERERMAKAEHRARRDRDSFEDPDRYRRRGEALLAGISRARREGGLVLVPDPYDPGSREIAIPVAPGRSLQDAADGCFSACRRARRGLAQATSRIRQLTERAGRLSEIEARFAGAVNETDMDRLESAMREQGIPIGLARPQRTRSRVRPERPRLEGVRIFRTTDGLTLLAGRSARDNQRLTFGIATPDDFWFHAADRRGAHVVLRNDERLRCPTPASLSEAAAVAAWFSEGREESLVDVRWTRRKYVRRARGASPGTVLLKRFETLRVRPSAPGVDPEATAGSSVDRDC